MLSGAAGSALDLIYPEGLYCICCGKMIDATRPYGLCNECMEGMRWANGRACAKCGKPLSETYIWSECYSCRGHEHAFDRGYTCAEYGVHERAVTQALKFGGRSDIAKRLAEMMHDRLSLARAAGEDCRYDAVVPVPMNAEKLRRRGYNQAALIARELAGLEGCECPERAVVRVKGTQAMKGLSADERRMNLAGAFAISGECPDFAEEKKLLIVDDIYTTGATADEVARVLRAGGAAVVDVISFAAGANVLKSEESCQGGVKS